MSRALPVIFIGVEENNCEGNGIPRCVVCCLIGIFLAQNNGRGWVNLDGLDGGWKILVVA